MEQSRDGDGLGGNNINQQHQAIVMEVDDDQDYQHGLADGATNTCNEDDNGVYFRHHPFTQQFNAAIYSLLVSCSRQEVLNYLAQFQSRRQDFLYKIFTFTVAEIRENVLAEFRSICKRTQILEALDYVDSGELLRSIDVRQSIFPKEVFREVAVKRKQEEVKIMKQKLQQTKEENNSLVSQLEGRREMVSEAKDLKSVDAAVEKVCNINLKLEKVARGDTFSFRNFR